MKACTDSTFQCCSKEQIWPRVRILGKISSEQFGDVLAEWKCYTCNSTATQKIGKIDIKKAKVKKTEERKRKDKEEKEKKAREKKEKEKCGTNTS